MKMVEDRATSPLGPAQSLGADHVIVHPLVLSYALCSTRPTNNYS